MDKLLTLLSQNARFTNAQLAVMLGTTEKEVEQKIEDYTNGELSADIKYCWIMKNWIWIW